MPCIPAIRCPGTEQKNVYVPGLSVSVSVLLPPLNVGVAPSSLPPAVVTVTLCGSGALFVRSIETLPALGAVSDVVSYFSCPDGSAASASRTNLFP